MLIIVMATASHWKDIEEGFFHCSICLDQYKEPKLLPCVHRFCGECLQKVIEKCLDTLECPFCKETCNIPKNGVEGFKTDFHMKSLLEVTKLQKSLDKEEIRECVGCSKQQEATSYCFKCIGFLCEVCYQFHLDSPMVKDHKPNVVTLKDIQQKGLSLGILSSLQEAPRCEVHPEKLSELCCVTCDNIPVCVACGTYGKHKGHNLQEITELANVERRKLVDNLSILDSHEGSIYSLPQEIEEFKEKLSTEINTKQEEIRMKHKTETDKIEAILQASHSKLDYDLQETTAKELKNFVNLNVEMEKEIQEIREKYKHLIETNTTEHDKKRQELRTEQNLQGESLTLRLKQLELCKTEFIKKVDEYTNKLDEHIKQLAADSEKRIARFDNYRTSANSILASNNDWTDVRCLPDINAAFKALFDDLTSDKFSNSRIFPDIKMPVSHVYIAEHPEPIVYIDKFKENDLKISGLACVEDGKIVVTGRTDVSNHVTVTNIKGEIIHQYHIKTDTSGSPRSSYCASISPTEVAIVVRPSEIGIFNVREYTYISKNIKDLTTEWTRNATVRCVATDPINCNIFVGTESRKVLIFDNEMNYRKTILLPDIITYARSMRVNDGNLLVCSYKTANDNGAYSLQIHENSCEYMSEFDVPDICNGNWEALDVYTDDSRLVYVRWKVALKGNKSKRFVTQYSQADRAILSTREMEVSRITKVKADDGEMLIGASYSNGKIVKYKLARI